MEHFDQDQAKHVIALSKTLRGYQLADARIARHLYASSFAGRAGLLVSAIRGFEDLSASAFEVMASNEGFTPIESRNTLIPWLEKQLLCHVVHDSTGPKSFKSLILTYEQILVAVFALWTELNPSQADKACVTAIGMCTELPMGRAELAQKLTVIFEEQTATLALELIKAYTILGCVERNLLEPIFYSQNVWRKNIASIASQLSLLDVTDKEVLLSMLARVKAHQGLPEQAIALLARQENAEHVLQLALRTGLLDKTTLNMPSGEQRAFLITPHFYADVEADHGEDFCDRVKIFLDSIRNGQHFGNIDGKINDPDRLLEVLLDRGWVGPAPAIGRGYTLPEKSGIVRVERDRSLSYPSFKLHVVQRDTIAVVRQIVGQRSTERILDHLDPAHLTGTSFVASETLRAAFGTAPTQILEFEADVIRTLRENGCRTRA